MNSSFSHAEPAEIVNHTQDTEVIIADSVTVFCEATGVYTPTIMWMRGNDVIENSSRVVISETVWTNGIVRSTLTIGVFTRSDTGVFSCRASNSAGVDEATFELTIQG